MDLTDRFHPRWWPLAAATATLVTVLWLLLFTWSGIRGSHPAYLIALVIVGLAAIGWAVWAMRSTAPERTPRRTLLSRIGMVLGSVLLLNVVVYPRPLTADQVAIDALADGSNVDISVSSSQIRMDPVDDVRSVGLVFYPGAKVDPRAYARILRPLAEDGYTVVILKLPFGIAFFDRNGAADVVGRRDDIDQWVIAGHSLGGTVASGFANRNDRGEIAGLLLWASFPASSLAGRTDLDVLSISGSNDGLATPAKIDASRSDLPPDSEFMEIEGALHAYFGDYGAQDGDGTAGVSRDVAQTQIIQATLVQLRRIENS
jgi:hypothetical protein